MTGPTRIAHVLVNPVARKVGRFDPHAALHRLRDWGIEATIIAPSSVDEFVQAARRAAAESVDLLFVAGGDGALRLAASELLHTSTALAPLPVGTANVLAKEAGIPMRVEKAIDAHALGQRVRMDTGKANGETFLMMAGIGWDADIAAHVQPGLKRRLGSVAYMYEMARAFRRLHPRHLDLRIDGRDLEGEWGLIVVSNTRLYGGLVKFTPEASVTDGLLDVCAAGPRGRGRGVEAALRLVTHRLVEKPGLHLDRGLEVEIPTHGIPVQVDGDVIGETPMRFTVRPKSLLLSVPAGPLAPAFADEAIAAAPETSSSVR